MLDHILAKSSGETLIQHTDEVINRWKALRTIYSGKITVGPEFWQLSFLSVLFHDIGKVALNFQDKIHNRVNNYDNYIRHEFLSGILLLFNDQLAAKEYPLPLLAIFSHHRPLVFEKLFYGDSNQTLRLNKDDLIQLDDYIRFKSEELGYNYKLQKALVGDFPEEIILKKFHIDFKTFLKTIGADLTPKSRIQYIYFKAILNTADWTASGHKKLSVQILYDEEYLRNKTIGKLKREGKLEIIEKFNWKKFQSSCLKQLGHVLAIAPTGSGKTEAALLWASNKTAEEKVLYLLPTKITSNAIYQRLIEYFGTEKSAVIHSSAFFYQKELNDDFKKNEYFKDKLFFKNINICTVDQILTQGFNLGYWEIKTFHMLNARVIIDEIHLYAPYTLGLIISTIKYLKNNFGTKFFVMTATMPEKLQHLLRETLEISDSQIIKDNQLLNEARNIFETRPFLVNKLEEEIIKEIKSGKKVLIVVNTVDEAIRLYAKFNGIAENTICYHSRYIQSHRITKEKEILNLEKNRQSLLLISTQVVEVSLDIDFDILFTENAPMDAIIQRAGRVNRKRKKTNTKIIVFKEQDVTREVIYTEVEGILENTFKELEARNGDLLSENDLLHMVNKVYSDYDIISQPSYIKGCNIYDEIQRKHHYVKDNTEYGEVYTREGLDTVSIIPSCYYEKLKIEHKFQNSEMTKHELSIRRSKFHALKNKFQYHQEEQYSFLGCKYTYEIGLEFDKPSNEKTTF